MIKIDGDFIREIAPIFTGSNGEKQNEIIDKISPSFSDILEKYEINSKLRIAHFMGQITHECAGFRTTEEFASGKAYEGRKDLGNVNPGDGVRYKGRGLIQLTGRSNYRTIGEKLNLPLEDNPEMAADPLISLLIACEYWKSKNINILADKDDLEGVTRKVNGGLNGLSERRNYYLRAKNILSFLDGTITVRLAKGSEGFEVKELQKRLNEKNNMNLSVDGDFGNSTLKSVIFFQQKNHLVADGIVGKNTWALLFHN